MSEYGTKWMEGTTVPRGKWVRKNEPEPTVTFEAVDPEPIIFEFGTIYEKLTGFLAWLYRGMIWMYGEEEAKLRFYRFGLFKPAKPEKKERRRYPARQHRRIPAKGIAKTSEEIIP